VGAAADGRHAVATVLTVAAIGVVFGAIAWAGRRSAARADEAWRNLLRLAADQAQDEEAARDERAIADNLDV